MPMGSGARPVPAGPGPIGPVGPVGPVGPAGRPGPLPAPLAKPCAKRAESHASLELGPLGPLPFVGPKRGLTEPARARPAPGLPGQLGEPTSSIFF